MSVNTIDAQMLARMFLSGARNLELKKEWINELNVFPVPDGDTGTNMTMTIQSAVGEVEKITELNMKTMAKAMSSGSLRGARGNSGVILSQLFRGFTKAIKETDYLDIDTLALACKKAKETAYKAVMKPKEGTILTVAKGMSDKAEELAETAGEEGLALEEFVRLVIEEGKATLEKTPEMLPVLKEAGVVDSGGQGLMCIMEGAYLALIGQEVVIGEEDQEKAELLRYDYSACFFINPAGGHLSEESVAELKEYMPTLGEAIVYPDDSGKVKVLMHTNDPGMALTKALNYGSLTYTEIHNLHEHTEQQLKNDAQDFDQLKEKAQAKEEEAEAAIENKPYGFISVSVGEGLSNIFKELGVDYLIEGGQTMNPSTEDMLQAIKHVHADTIFILPNNKNIVMAANQARDLTTDKKIIVIPSKTIPQGLSAMIGFVPELSAEDNEEAMKDAISAVRTAQLTYAVRDTKIDDKEIHENDIMAVGDDGILAVGTEIASVALEAVACMADDDAELISIYYGADYSEEAANALAEELTERYPDCDIEVNDGGQPIYYCILSVE